MRPQSTGLSHKTIILDLYFDGCSTPEIAGKTKHSNEAVDRYIRYNQRVEIL
ncbi:MAG TPA: DUF1670 domain-containing protein [Caldithrix abyssi]|uniref:DUF1670 domain-containing protein n=1 Tax=Caldithrix abyssi TaxID=187145 RepID=A0A7V4WWQ3_CALAY|nr:DUF1670 domain-containing protein [Caldithrix abyssi]